MPNKKQKPRTGDARLPRVLPVGSRGKATSKTNRPTIQVKAHGTELTRYDAACRALAAARSVDEVKEIHNVAAAMRAYARQARNRELEANATEIRMRATRRLDEMRRAQKDTVGLAKGGGDKRSNHRVKRQPSDPPTLAEAGIDKNLAQQGRVLGALSDEEFEQKVAEEREEVKREAPRAVGQGRGKRESVSSPQAANVRWPPSEQFGMWVACDVEQMAERLGAWAECAALEHMTDNDDEHSRRALVSALHDLARRANKFADEFMPAPAHDATPVSPAATQIPANDEWPDLPECCRRPAPNTQQGER